MFSLAPPSIQTHAQSFNKLTIAKENVSIDS